jgi:glycosyltransferase involved in cell wall biosynthesis
VGCDLQAFDPQRFSAAERDAVRSRLGIPANAFVVAYVGRQVDFKGFPVVVRGYQAAKAAGLNGWLLLVGEADAAHRSGLSADELRSVAADPRIVRAGWQWDVAPYLDAADVSVLPSIREGMPVSAMESLALGTPVITVDARGCRDVVRDRVDGMVLAKPSPQQLAAALLECAANRRLLDDFRRAAIAGRNRFDSRYYTEEQIKLYSKMLARRDGIQAGRSR